MSYLAHEVNSHKCGKMPEKTLSTTVRFTEDFNAELRITMARRRVRSLQQAIDEALELWLKKADPAEGAEPPPAELAGATKEELAWCGKLVSLLREGEPAAVDLVQHAMNRHARQMRERRKQAGA